MVMKLGTSSWGAKGWLGTFYPKGTPAISFLKHYATQFGAVEADNTYYRVPTAKSVQGWEQRVPEGFTFCAKFPSTIVHGGKGPTPDAQAILDGPEAKSIRDLFLERMSLMGSKLGPLLIQFPYFNRKAFAGPEPFLTRLDAFLAELPKSMSFAVEVRNRQWVAEPLLQVLRAHSVALVWADLPHMPRPWQVDGDLDLQTAGFTYTRLIGDRRATDALTTTFSEPVLNKEAELLEWAQFLSQFKTSPETHLVFANNHYAGHGPATVRQLGDMLDLNLEPPQSYRQGELPL